MPDAFNVQVNAGPFPGIGTIPVANQTIPFISVVGELPLIQYVETELTRRGQSGRSYRYEGNLSNFTSVVTVADPVTAADAQNLRNLYKSLKGNKITITQYGALQEGTFRVKEYIRGSTRVFGGNIGGVYGGNIEMISSFIIERTA